MMWCASPVSERGGWGGLPVPPPHVSATPGGSRRGTPRTRRMRQGSRGAPLPGRPRRWVSSRSTAPSRLRAALPASGAVSGARARRPLSPVHCSARRRGAGAGWGGPCALLFFRGAAWSSLCAAGPPLAAPKGSVTPRSATPRRSPPVPRQKLGGPCPPHPTRVRGGGLAVPHADLGGAGGSPAGLRARSAPGPEPCGQRRAPAAQGFLGRGALGDHRAVLPPFPSNPTACVSLLAPQRAAGPACSGAGWALSRPGLGPAAAPLAPARGN